MTDPIADMLTQIRNALMVGGKTCLVRHSKIKEKILEIMEEEGFIRGFKNEEKNSHKNIRIQLAYNGNRDPAIKSIKRISKPGRRIYSAKANLVPVLGGLGIKILSTSGGIMSDKKAKKEGFGGEVICEVW